jgi:hypothetical protein
VCPDKLIKVRYRAAPGAIETWELEQPAKQKTATVSSMMAVT